MTRLLLLVPRDLAADLEWLRIDADGSVLERGHASGLPAGSRGLLVVPGATTRTHWIGQTAHSPAQARAVATAALQGDAAAASATDLHVAVAPDGDGWMAVAVAPARMHEWLERAAGSGFGVDAIVPDYLLLPAGNEAGDGVQVLDLGDAWLVRGQRLAFGAEPGLAALVVGDQPLQRHGASERDAVFARGALVAPIDLLQGSFAADAGSSRLASPRRMPVLAAVLLLSPLLLLAAEALRYHWAASQARAEATAIARDLVPGAGADAPAAATGDVLARLRHGDIFNRQLGAVFAAASAVPGVQVEALRHDGNHLKATLSHPDAATLEAVVAALASRAIAATAGAGIPGANGIRTELDLGAGA